MSDLWNGKVSPSLEEDHPSPGITTILEPVDKDLGGFVVRRLLPAAARKRIGPFVFFDHLGPVAFPPGAGVDIRPHPHIGLATVTYLLEGEIVHRDSLGKQQTIRANEINLMTAGRGISHSERTGFELRKEGHRLHALQLWVALPAKQERCAPDFHHYDANRLPTLEQDGVSIRLLIGAAFGLQSEVRTFSKTLFVDVTLEAGASLTLPGDIEERAVYLIAGSAQARGHHLDPHRMTIFDPDKEVTIKAAQEARLVIIGGNSIGKRTVWWNLVASDRALIEQAKRDWSSGRFPMVPGETEFIPLPTEQL